jgi:3-hydroxyisobutyrate dehydrogenase
MIAGDFAPGFMIKLQQKDLRLVAEAAEEIGLNLTALAHVHALFDLAGQEGRGGQGTQALFAMVEKMSSSARRS